MATYLDRILEAHRSRAAAPADRAALEEAIAAAEPVRDFRAALAATPSGAIHVIAELKRASPQKGVLAEHVDASEVGREYRSGGASCLSVLTDERFFGGSSHDLRLAREASGLPVLRKDFTVVADDVRAARAMGADAVLLIVAALVDGELRDFHDLALELGMSALVECHDESELERGLAVGASLIGVNQRDLVTFSVDTDRAVRLASQIPAGVVAIAESGVGGAADARRLADAGYAGVLVGEHLITAANRPLAVRELREAACS